MLFFYIQHSPKCSNFFKSLKLVIFNFYAQTRGKQAKYFQPGWYWSVGCSGCCFIWMVAGTYHSWLHALLVGTASKEALDRSKLNWCKCNTNAILQQHVVQACQLPPTLSLLHHDQGYSEQWYSGVHTLKYVTRPTMSAKNHQFFGCSIITYELYIPTN